jgi:hypothetical protein
MSNRGPGDREIEKDRELCKEVACSPQAWGYGKGPLV